MDPLAGKYVSLIWDGLFCQKATGNDISHGGLYRAKTEYCAEHILAAYSALRHLTAAEGGLLANAPGVLAQALDCPWALVLGVASRPSGAAPVISSHGLGDDAARITEAALALVARNHDAGEIWSGPVTVAGLGVLQARGQRCRDENGIDRAYLLAFSRRPDGNDDFAETYMALMAAQIGRQVHMADRENSAAETPEVQDWFRQAV
jgi:hypothetical protein